jgi:hypothetical protein
MCSEIARVLRPGCVREREDGSGPADREERVMKAGRTTRARQLVAVAAIAVGALAVGESASARVPIPEKPEVTTGTRVKVEKVAPTRRFELRIVALGTSNPYGLELFATTRDGRIVGIPMG